MSDNGDAWLGWSYWAAGEWWPADEPFNVQPRKGTERPQMRLLSNSAKAKAGACASVKPAGN